jgi:hypothetical protein
MTLRNFNINLSATAAAINPADFVSVIDNPYFPLEPGTTYITQSPDGSAIGTFAVTRQTKVVDGVTCIVISDISTVNGELEEKTEDYFAQDKAGNVWYFGEKSAQYENGQVVSTKGSWLAGVNGAAPGIVMEAHPHIGDQYNQENAPGVAEDMAKVLSLSQSVDVPYGTYDHILQTREFSPLDPGSVEHKYYLKGVGFMLAVDLVTGEVEQLVKVKIDGTSKDDTLTGKVGSDELNGNGGNDHLNGLGGGDIIHGGAGNDGLYGGNDHVVDLLYGDAGNDHIRVGASDEGFGGTGNDLMHLIDIENFGFVDGGGQTDANLAHGGGDVLLFSGDLDFTTPALSDRVIGIETVSMRNNHDEDSLKLTAADVVTLGDGTYDPGLGKSDAIRVNGDSGDHLTLAGGSWIQVLPSHAPAGYDVYLGLTGGSAPDHVYALVEHTVSVTLT